MDDISKIQLWFRRALYALTCWVLIFIPLIPLNMSPSVIAAPDIMLCLTTALVVRRAVYAPVWLVAIMFLMADILLDRPLGLWSFIVVAAIEMIRANRLSFREMFFVTEWAIVSLGFCMMMLMQQFLLGFVLLPRLPLAGTLWQLGLTIACYSVTVFVISEVLRVRKPTPGQYNSFGQKL